MTQRRVWAPFAQSVELVTAERRIQMTPASRGWWSAELAESDASADYAFSVNGKEPRPDPRSQSQPHGVFGFSQPVDHSHFHWTDSHWHQPALGLIYECHIGTFTPSGTFDAAIERLDYLRDLGVTHLEIMPVAEFAGAHGWGYDGVDLYAPHHIYGGVEGLKRLIDRSHNIGLGVIIDVVYNHLGPSGNFIPEFGPYLTDHYRTPWGDAINLDGEYSDEVRRFLCDNALMWLRDYHVDGLRLDAVHAIYDSSAVHFLEQLASEVKALAAHLGRELFLVAESSLNSPRLVTAREAGGFGLDAHWSDDFHHAVHACMTGERSGYYADFGSIAQLAKSLSHAYVYDGAYSPFRKRSHGTTAAGLPANRFVVCIQNHDQIGNRAKGERLGHLVNQKQLKIASALMMCSPFVPLLFQGEEWNASTPFQYFENHEDAELVAAICEGRRNEFAELVGNIDDVPDSHAYETFDRSKLDWDERERGQHDEILDWYRRLIALRRNEPDLRDPRLERTKVEFDENQKWLRLRRGSIVVICNLGNSPRTMSADQQLHLLLASENEIQLGTPGIILPAQSVAIARSTTSD